MIFYVKDKEELENVPSSYTIINISRAEIPNTVMYPIVPTRTYIKNGKELFKNELEEKRALISSIVYNGISASSLSCVLYVPEFEQVKHDFNVLKTIRKFIKNNYGVKPIRFTNCVTREIRESFKLSTEAQAIIIKDMEGIVK